jgi:iron complex outermembrane receptor protein
MSNRFFKGSLLTTTVIAGMAFAGPAYAQDASNQPGTQTSPATTTTGAPDPASDEPEAPVQNTNDGSSNETIVVTGTLIRRTNSETPSPVTVLSAESLAQRGINTVADAVQRVSAGNAGTMTQGWNTGNNFASGANAVSLRGLTVQSTLTIFDGLRMAPYPLADDGQRNFVDLNSIPNAIIDRIEILRDGASSTYGADAVAGVINVITKKEIQGLHVNGSAGISSRGDAGERRLDVTYGYGDLDDKGFNFYVSGEYQKMDVLWARDRGFPYDTQDLSSVCNDDNSSCMQNGNWNGISQSGAYNGLISIPGVALVRPASLTNPATGAGRFSFLNESALCRGYDVVNPTGAATTTPLVNGVQTSCEVDFQNQFQMLQPEIERKGFSARFTFNLGENHQLYAQGNWYRTDTFAQFTPLGFNGTPTPPVSATTVAYNAMLPVYVCPTGIGTPNGLNTGCTAANGTLNPYNPFAASGRTAQLFFRSTRGRSVETHARALRGVIGLEGTIFGDWNYSTSFVASQVQLDRIQDNYYIPQRIADVLARGLFNFNDPESTPEEVWDYIGPQNRRRSTSDLWQATATVSRSLFELPGGPLGVAAGLSYRHESIDAPSANPGVELSGNQYERYYSINSVGTNGSRNVVSAFGEVSAPILDQLEVQLSGRYDKYSSGQKNFSPKIGAKFTPIRELALRGTYSKGFRIPSFNESFGLPTTGYVNRPTVCGPTPLNAAFCAAHGNNAYVTGPFSVGLTQTGNDSLDPEKSTSMTVGAIFEPVRNVSFTVDFFKIKVKDLIVGVTDIGPVVNQYYTNNGQVNIPGFIVIPGQPDPAFPNALPHIGFIQSSYVNADSQVVSGIDLGMNVRYNITPGLRLISSFEASYLHKNDLTPVDPVTGEVGDKLKYAGTLSPCNVTSCSGAPRWRASWQNTFVFGNTSLSATAYYTKGVDYASVDFGATPGDCQSAADNGSAPHYEDGSPVACRSKNIWNLDLAASHKVGDRFTIYANVLNALDIDAPFDHGAAYGAYNYNPSFAGPNIMGRYFRVGAKVDF